MVSQTASCLRFIGGSNSAGLGRVPLLTVVMLLAFVTLCGCDRDNRFESARWRQENPGNDDRWPYRADMVKDLVENHNFRGWERSSLVALLGPPDEANWLSTGDFGYLIGEVGLGYEYLIFKFDSGDEVLNYEVIYVGF